LFENKEIIISELRYLSYHDTINTSEKIKDNYIIAAIQNYKSTGSWARERPTFRSSKPR
jgi:hypothetical protein